MDTRTRSSVYITAARWFPRSGVGTEKPENEKRPPSLFLAKEKRPSARKTIDGKGTRRRSTGPDTDKHRQ